METAGNRKEKKKALEQGILLHPRASSFSPYNHQLGIMLNSASASVFAAALCTVQ